MKNILTILTMLSILASSDAKAAVYRFFECGSMEGPNSSLADMYYRVDLKSKQLGSKQIISGDHRSHNAEPIVSPIEITIRRNVKMNNATIDIFEVRRLNGKLILKAGFRAGVYDRGAQDQGEGERGSGNDGKRNLLCDLGE